MQQHILINDTRLFHFFSERMIKETRYACPCPLRDLEKCKCVVNVVGVNENSKCDIDSLESNEKDLPVKCVDIFGIYLSPLFLSLNER